jgi:hypothetical protein
VIGELHHVELRVNAVDALSWLLAELGYDKYQEWSAGVSWKLGATYIVLEVWPGSHDRRLTGLSHLAFDGGSRVAVDQLTADALERGFTLLYTDRHPFAGGLDHYAAFLETDERFKVELVAR